MERFGESVLRSFGFFHRQCKVQFLKHRCHCWWPMNGIRLHTLECDLGHFPKCVVTWSRMRSFHFGSQYWFKVVVFQIFPCLGNNTNYNIIYISQMLCFFYESQNSSNQQVDVEPILICTFQGLMSFPMLTQHIAKYHSPLT